MIGGIVMMEDGTREALAGATQSPPLPPEPISAGLGIDYTFPPHLEYVYPPPDGNILTNIVNALIAAPQFYSQVLHVMNKMNLPAPFRPALPTPPLPHASPVQFVPKRQAGDLSSGESELESCDEEDENDPNDSENNLPGARKSGNRKDQANKRAKRGAILGPAVDKSASHEAAGVKAIDISKASSLIKKKPPALQIKIAPKVSMSDVERLKSKVGEGSQAESPQEQEQLATASREELEAGKLRASDMLSLPIFKKYAPGNPTPVLYIKNLAKGVTPEDMYYIFGAFFSNRTDAIEQLSIKVMQEGRMRGQAFVSLPSTELAKAALAGTHGFVFKGKPMVVQYGHNDGVAKSSVLKE